jgi:hypothetical protein
MAQGDSNSSALVWVLGALGCLVVMVIVAVIGLFVVGGASWFYAAESYEERASEQAELAREQADRQALEAEEAAREAEEARRAAEEARQAAEQRETDLLDEPEDETTEGLDDDPLDGLNGL